MAEHVILFLAANPHGSSERKLSDECAAIQRELKLAPHRGDFRFEARWAVGIDELMRHLNEFDPAVIHFSGHGSPAGVLLQDEQGRPQVVSPRSLALMIEAAARKVRVVVLNACYSSAQADALRTRVDCVVGMDGAIGDAAARAFAIRFYGALASRRSIGNAVAQGVAALAARELPEEAQPRCLTREGVDADQVVLPALANSPAASQAAAVRRSERIDFRIERDRHRDFVGRAALLARLDQLLVADRADRWVVVTGGPGMGKSAILARWLALREAAGASVPHHFIRRGEYEWDVPARLVGSLIAQIEASHPGCREPAERERLAPAVRLAAMLAQVSGRALVPHGERLILLIDGLNEYDAPLDGAGDPLTAFLPHALPAGVSVLCASRPHHPYVPMLRTRAGSQFWIDLDAPDSAGDNTATVRSFWDRAAPALELDAAFVDEAVARAAGNLQHAVMLHRHLEGLSASDRRVESLPEGLEALLMRSWERIAVDPVAVAGLGVLCAAYEALTLDEIGTVTGWTGPQQRWRFLHGARELLVETRRADHQRAYRLHHESIRAQIASALGPTAVRRHHAALAHRLATWPPPGEIEVRPYALRYALSHRVDAGDWAGAWRLAADLGFLEARCCELGVHDAEADVTRAATRCRAGGDPALVQRFDDLARALVRESHWLRQAPDAVAAMVWNRLRRWGWSARALDEQLRVSPGATHLRVRQVVSRDSPALLRNLADHIDGVLACTVTPDGRHVVSASADRTLKLWDAATGRVVRTLEGHTGEVLACAVTPDGRHLVSTSADRTLRLWDLANGRAIATLEGHSDPVAACALTRDDRHLVSASHDGSLKLWDLATGGAITAFVGHAGPVFACAVTPDGHGVISASWDGTLKLWDLASGRVVTTLEGHGDSVTACAVTPDGRCVVSASEDQTLKVWDLASGRVRATLAGHTNWVTGCAVTPDGLRVVSASHDQTLKLWDLATGRDLLTLEGHVLPVTGCAVTPDGLRVVSASHDQTLKLWDLATGRGLERVEGHTDAVTACAVAADRPCVVTGSSDRTLKLWDLATGGVLVTVQGHAGRVTACAVTPDGQRVVSSSEDQTIRVWDAAGRLLATLETRPSLVTACAVTPDGERVVYASYDRTLRVRDVATGRVLATLEGLFACTVTPDGRHVISASWDRTLQVWDLAAGRRVMTLAGHSDRVTACAVTPDGQRVLSASRDRTLRLWDLATGRVLATLRHHTDGVNACAVTPDGRRLLSASADRTLKLWDLATHECLFTHRGDNAFTSVAATSTTIVAGDAAGAVWFLDLPGAGPPAQA